MNAFDEHCSLIEAIINRNPSTESVLREKTSFECKYERLCSAHTDVIFSMSDETVSKTTWQARIYDKFTKYVNMIDDCVQGTKNKSKISYGKT